MTTISVNRSFIFLVALLVVAPLSPGHAKDKVTSAASTDSPSSDTVAPDQSGATKSSGSAAKQAGSATVAVGDLIISHISADASKTHIDVFMTIKNNGKSDERITGAGSTWDIGDVVEVKKDKDGKEVESPAAIDIPADKSTDLSDKTVWLRVKDVKTKAKESAPMPLTLYFRHSPNASLEVSAGEGKGGGWFSQ